ncbi:MAG: cytochrome c3 family protein [Sulfurovum sp.]
MKIIKIIVSMLIGITAVFGSGPHDAITCLGCHSAHFAMANKAFAVKNTAAINPRTGEKINGLVANRCLGCHQLEENGGAGIKPIHLHITHPIGMVPNLKIADVPESLLNKGRLDCVSCHEAHPSNDYFMYLRVDTKNGKYIEHFCVVCHSAKGDLEAMGFENSDSIQVFSAMNQENGASSASRKDSNVHNPTPEYIMPLGEVPKNTITPNYLSPPDWIYKPKQKYIDAIQKQMGKVVKKARNTIEKIKTIEVKKVVVLPKIVLPKVEVKKVEIKEETEDIFYEFNRDGYMYIPTDGDDYIKINLK